jgi:hypothetical protein
MSVVRRIERPPEKADQGFASRATRASYDGGLRNQRTSPSASEKNLLAAAIVASVS